LPTAPAAHYCSFAARVRREEPFVGSTITSRKDAMDTARVKTLEQHGPERSRIDDMMDDNLTTVHSEVVADLRERIDALERQAARAVDPDSLCLVVFSGELDRLLAAFVIATGAAASDMNVSVFFTFWGTAALKKPGPQVRGKSLVERAFGWMLPGGLHKRRLSKLDFGGLGRRILAREMQKKRVSGLPELIEMTAQLDVEITICEMSMSLMGIRREELIEYPNLKFAGVATFLEKATAAGTTLFI